ALRSDSAASTCLSPTVPGGRRIRLSRHSSRHHPARGRSIRPCGSVVSERESRAEWAWLRGGHAGPPLRRQRQYRAGLSLRAQVFVEEVQRPLPRKLGGGFVVPWRRVVVEAVLRSLVHERLVLLAVRLERGLERGP